MYLYQFIHLLNKIVHPLLRINVEEHNTQSLPCSIKSLHGISFFLIQHLTIYIRLYFFCKINTLKNAVYMAVQNVCHKTTRLFIDFQLRIFTHRSQNVSFNKIYSIGI